MRLANDPELVELLAKEPGKCDNFAEEILRHESPVQGLFRMTTADVEVAGVTIPKGSLVNLRYGSANRDEQLAIYKRIQKTIAAEQPQIYLWYAANVIVARKRITNINIDPSGAWYFLQGISAS